MRRMSKEKFGRKEWESYGTLTNSSRSPMPYNILWQGIYCGKGIRAPADMAIQQLSFWRVATIVAKRISEIGRQGRKT